MEDRIRFIEHQGKRILLVDASHCTAREVETLSLLVPSYVAEEVRASVLLLADFTGAEFDRAAIDQLKAGAVSDRPYLKRSAWVGIDTMPHVFYEHLKNFTQRELVSFKTREEALAWLVKDEN